jgi:hypothetical protein
MILCGSSSSEYSFDADTVSVGGESMSVGRETIFNIKYVMKVERGSEHVESIKN